MSFFSEWNRIAGTGWSRSSIAGGWIALERGSLVQHCKSGRIYVVTTTALNRFSREYVNVIPTDSSDCKTKSFVSITKLSWAAERWRLVSR